MGLGTALLDLLVDRPAPGQPLDVRTSKPVSFVGERTRTSWGDDSTRTASAAVYRCIQAIASQAASLDLGVIRGDDEMDLEHPFALLFNRTPNPALSARLVKEVMFSRLEWRGEAYLYLDRGPTGEGEVREVWPIYAATRPVLAKGEDGAERLSGYQVDLGGGKKIGLLPAEVLHLRYPDPDNPWGALAPWRAAQFAADLDAKARDWQAGELTHGGKASAVVYLGDLEPDDHDRAVAQWNAQIAGPRSANRHLLVSGPTPAAVQRLGFTAQELAYLDSRRANLEEVALAFGVPRDYLVGGSTYENQRTAKTTLWSDTIVPKLEVVASEVDRQVLPDLTETAAFDVTRVEALQENADSVVARTVAKVQHDLLTLNEARAELGQDPRPGFDVTLSQWRAGRSEDDAPLADVVPIRVQARPRVVTRHGLHLLRPAAPPAVEVRRVVTKAETVQRIYDRHERVGRKALERLAKKQARVVLRNLDRNLDRAGAGQWLTRATAGDVFDEAFWREQTRESLEGFVAGVWEDGAATTGTGLGIDFARFDLLVLTAMEGRLDTLAAVVTETTRQAIEEGVLLPGVAAGKSIPDLRRDLQAVFTDLGSRRAETIARTETVGGFNGASRVIAVGTGLVTRRRWLAASDDRVRDSHAELDGYSTAGPDDPYPNGLLYPGDPSGDPAETINCRCVEEYVTEKRA